jgi:signal transduction histidine kinase
MLTTWLRAFREHPRVVDAALVLLLCVNSIFGSTIANASSPAPRHWWPGVLLTSVAACAMPWRRSHPRAVTALTAACAVAVSALGYTPTVLVIGPLGFALYALADRTDRKTANTIAFASAAAVSAAAALASPHESIGLTVVSPIAWLLLPTALGTITRVRRDYLRAVQARAAFAEQTREQEARRRVAEERMRIARDLHDVVAHHLTLANAQAGTAAHLARTRPELAREILAELTATTSAALRELKATVGLLRQPDDPDAPLHPAPGLAQLPELTASFAATGLDVVVATDGTPQPIDAGVDLTAFRIIQEALTNVAKHATTSTARVDLTYHGDQLTLTVTNDSDNGAPALENPAPPIPTPTTSAPTTPSTGFGLIGMRERADSVGGRLHTRQRPEGGFEVTADLPLHTRKPEEDPRP